MTARATAGWRRPVTLGALLLATVVLAGCGNDARADGDPLLVAGAADLQPAFLELGASFTAETGQPVTFSFGSSGQLAQQLLEGAPMDVYASANVDYVEQVLAGGVGDPDTQATYALGRLTIWTPPGAWGGWEDLVALAADPSVDTIAIANPAHAPYGLAAQQALTRAGVWDDIADRIVYGENVADTQRLAATGNADAAVVALSLALAADEGDGGAWVLVDDTLHEPLQQDLVVVAEDPDRARAAQRFVDHVLSEDGRAVMRRFGFLLPGEGPSDGSGG